MNRTDEVRMLLGGDELEIRRLSAFELLSARKTARELSSELGVEGGDEQIVLAAAIVAQSAFADDGPAFDSALDALEKLTADELFEAAAENAVKERNTEDIAFDAEKANFLHAGNMQEQTSGGIPERAVRVDMTAQDTPYIRQMRDDRADERHMRYESMAALHVSVPSGAAPDADAGYISDVFERDSRRYDGAFERF